MDSENQIGYYAIIPANVRYDKELKPAEKLLYGEVTALANKYGYCYAKNGYFADLYGTTKGTVSKWLGNLQKLGYITIEIIKSDNNEVKERRIYIMDNTYSQKRPHPYDSKRPYPYSEKEPYPMVKNDKYNNININNTFSNSVSEKKEDKIKYDEKVEMTENEYNGLIEKLGKEKTEDYIERLNLHKKSKGVKYEDDYATILKWNKDDEVKYKHQNKLTYANLNNSNCYNQNKITNSHSKREYPPGFLDNIYANFRMIGKGGENNDNKGRTN